MNILVCASGTLGHINPAINVSCELLNHNHKVYFLTLDKNEIDIDNIEVIKIKGESFDRKKLFSNIIKITDYFKSINEIKRFLKEKKINLVISFGSVSGTLAMIAKGRNKKIKGIIHEQNAVLGLGNKLAMRYANKVLLTYNNNLKGTVIGNPVNIENDHYYSYNKQKNVLITCGTNGAKRINDFFSKNIDYFISNSDYNFTLVTGDNYYKENKEIINKVSNERFKILPRQRNLKELYNDNCIVVCRSGSTTLHEVLGLNKLVVTIPSPNVTGNHQFLNADYYFKKGCLEVVNENDLSTSKLIELFNMMIKNKYSYYDKIKKYYIKNSLELFIKEIDKLMEDNNE